MDIEAWFGFIILYVIPIIYQTYKGIEKKRNIIITFIFSFILVSCAWGLFIAFLMYSHYGYNFFLDLNITLWIAAPILIFGGIPFLMLLTYILSPFLSLYDYYVDKGEIKFNISHVSILIKKIFRK